ncbi:uncharacterized protein LOC6638458 [Drosophila willistoni]|uniref:uncharacterized protein LOC6638458 n=1 Tax=Drosophila willistoni TaxID=7260 RepID=UPI001F078FF1|nr:uncharacterized protein LOC6638458 [Drosophila willistoni]
MENCLRSGNLPFFWHPELNMLSILTREQIQEMFIVARNHTKCLYDIINNNGVYRRLEQLRFFFTLKEKRVQPCDRIIKMKKKISYRSNIPHLRMALEDAYFSSGASSWNEMREINDIFPLNLLQFQPIYPFSPIQHNFESLSPYETFRMRQPIHLFTPIQHNLLNIF